MKIIRHVDLRTGRLVSILKLCDKGDLNITDLKRYFGINISFWGSHTYVQAIVVDKPASPLFAENMIVLSIPLSLPIPSFMSKAPPFGDNKLFALCQKSAAQQQFSSTYDHHRHQHYQHHHQHYQHQTNIKPTLPTPPPTPLSPKYNSPTYDLQPP